MTRTLTSLCLSLAVAAFACGESSESEPNVDSNDSMIQVEKRTAADVRQDLVAARDGAKDMRQHATRLAEQSNALQSGPALEDLRRVAQSTREAVRRLREKLQSPQATPGSKFARVPDEEFRRVMDKLADVNDAYLEKLEEELPHLAQKIRNGGAIAEVERDAIIVHVLDVIHNLNFALRAINDWIAEADNVALPRCAGSNRWGSFPAGGRCTVFGCSPEGGGCNLFGCFRAGGECNLHSCRNEIEPGEILCRVR